MRIKLICCDVFLRIICRLVSESENIVDVEFVPMLAHNEPDKLREDLQRRINQSVKMRDYDAIVLGYGLCGNATAGLTAPVKLIIPRAHDCCTILMGSGKRFMKEFGDALSTRWSANGYFERCHMINNNYDEYQTVSYKTKKEYIDLVEKFGEDNAEYVWETMHPAVEMKESVYIHIDGFEYSQSRERYREMILSRDKEIREVQGSIALLDEMVNGPWDESRFLTVEPGKKIAPLYDMERVITAEKHL